MADGNADEDACSRNPINGITFMVTPLNTIIRLQPICGTKGSGSGFRSDEIMDCRMLQPTMFVYDRS